MPKVNDESLRRILNLQDKRKNLAEQKERLDREDWFLIDVQFTLESLANYQIAHAAYPEILIAWRDEQAQIPESKKTFLDILEPFPPFPPSAYDMGDFLLHRGEQAYCRIEKNADSTSERWAVRSCEFARLEAKGHILSITVVDQGERVALLVEETRRSREAERAAELVAQPDQPVQSPRGTITPLIL
jgi:hypothetical protein